MPPRTRRVGALLVTALLVLSALPGLAAAETRTGGSVVVAEGETVDGLEAFGGSVVVRGTVDGDLDAFAGDVTIAPGGRVTGDVETAAGNVRIAGDVGGSVEAAAGSVTVAEGATVGGSLQAGAGSVRIDGTVRGDVTVGAESVVLGPAASVAGDLTYDGRLSGNREAVAGTIDRDPTLSGGPTVGPAVPSVADWVLGVYAFLANLALGVVLLVAAPAVSRRVTDRAVASPLRAGGAGLLALVGTVLALVALAVTIVGIPLSLLGAVLFGLIAWVGAVYGRIVVGAWLLSYTDVDSRWAALAVGFLVVGAAIRVPWLGGLVDLAVFLLGLGALALVGDDWRRARRETSDPAAEGEAPPA